MNRELHRSAFREEELAHEDGFLLGVQASIALLRAERYLDAAEFLERAKIVEKPPGVPEAVGRSAALAAAGPERGGK